MKKMPKTIKASGKTVEDAIKNGLEKLDALISEVNFEVLDEGDRGSFLFGRGGHDAVVRIELKQGRRSEGRSEGRGAKGKGNRTQQRGKRTRSSRPERDTTQAKGKGVDTPPNAEYAGPELTEADFFKGIDTEKESSTRSGEGRNKKRDSNRGERQSSRSTKSREDSKRPQQEKRPQQDEYIEPDIHAEEVDFAAGMVDDILHILDIDAEIEIREPLTPAEGIGSSLAVIDIMGMDLGMLIGRRGESLLAFQYLVNAAMTRHSPNRGGIMLDIEHYRQRRAEEIVSLAERMAEQVQETGAPITLEPMSPAERRIVHLALEGIDDIETNSVGGGESRKVVISAVYDDE